MTCEVCAVTASDTLPPRAAGGRASIAITPAHDGVLALLGLDNVARHQAHEPRRNPAADRLPLPWHDDRGSREHHDPPHPGSFHGAQHEAHAIRGDIELRAIRTRADGTDDRGAAPDGRLDRRGIRQLALHDLNALGQVSQLREVADVSDHPV